LNVNQLQRFFEKCNTFGVKKKSLTEKKIPFFKKRSHKKVLLFLFSVIG